MALTSFIEHLAQVEGSIVNGNNAQRGLLELEANDPILDYCEETVIRSDGQLNEETALLLSRYGYQLSVKEEDDLGVISAQLKLRTGDSIIF